MLRRADLSDIAFIRAVVGSPENAGFLTDEDDAALAAYLNGPKSQVLIWGDGVPRGFAIFCDIGDPSETVCLMRLALAAPGQGEGRVFLRTLVDHGFTTLNAQRLWLDVSGENHRAQRAYARAGFVLEGRLRQHEYLARTGQVIDTLLYGMLRPEWEALEPLSPRP